MFDSLLQRFGGFLKIGFLAVLALLLLIPVEMVRSMVSERDERARNVVTEISSKWGESQYAGAVRLDVPCERSWTDTSGKPQKEILWIHAWPRKLDITGTMESEIRKRGIYRVPLYVANLEMDGEFQLPDPSAMGLAAYTPRWSEARMAVDAGETQSLARPPVLTVGGNPVDLAPTGAVRSGPESVAEVRPESRRDAMQAPHVLEREPVLRLGGAVDLGKAASGSILPFHFQASLRGQGLLALQPLAKVTTVRLKSDWASPSFDGRFLPSTRNVRPDGFEASWSVSSLNLDVPTTWSGTAGQGEVPYLGVRMVQPVDDYDSSDRSLKYAFLFITLTFLAFFLFETFLATNLHPVQYVLVGLANCLFYLLTLAVAEHLGFDAAYWISAGLTTWGR